MYVHAHLLSHIQLFAILWIVARQAPLSMGFFRQGELPDPGIEPAPLESPALAGGFFTTAPPGKPR